MDPAMSFSFDLRRVLTITFESPWAVRLVRRVLVADATLRRLPKHTPLFLFNAVVAPIAMLVLAYVQSI